MGEVDRRFFFLSSGDSILNKGLRVSYFQKLSLSDLSDYFDDGICG
jgi:hypothetical protein